MIDWLSLIEQHNDFMLARELTEESRREYKERERMARVIREATKLLRIELELASTVDEAAKCILQLEALPLLSNMSDELKELLSPDAKELINDCAASSST